MASYKKKYKKSWRFENNILKKYIPLQRFNKAIDCITFIVAVSFASCGNKAADAAKATADSIRIADSIAAVEAAALEAEQAAAAAADSLNADSTATETVAE